MSLEPRPLSSFTYEKVEELMPWVIKKDGRREPYAREKVLAGLLKSCQKRNIATSKVEEICNTIEKWLEYITENN